MFRPIHTGVKMTTLLFVTSLLLGCSETGVTASPDGPADSTDRGPNATADTSGASGSGAPGTDPVDECASPDPAWIWCDDFERDRTGSYFEHDAAAGSFVRRDGVGVEGSAGMRARFRRGQVDAGSLRLAFGRTPQDYFRPVDEGRDDYRDIYWRIRLRHQEGWVGGGGDKLSRATAFVSSDSWAQAMIGHVWSGSGEKRNLLVLDPASGTDVAGTVRTTRYNDFQRLRWLGQVPGTTPIFQAERTGRWYCIEAHVRLNAPGQADGVFELWVDGRLEARAEGLNWVGGFTEYGINAVFLENYWNDGAPRAQERYFDGFVVSTEEIGC